MKLIDADEFFKKQVKRCGGNSSLTVGTCTTDNVFLSEELKKSIICEIGRCVDCKNYHCINAVWMCTHFFRKMGENDFCSRFEYPD